MCRFAAYRGEAVPLAEIVYRPGNSLANQAAEAMESPTRINADGFGIGWYNPGVSPEPAVFKSTLPAFTDPNLRSLCEIVEAGCLFAHVRAARSHDPVSRSNCHPFRQGSLLWMHNGDVPGRGRLHRRVVGLIPDELAARIEGNTDAELLFFLFLNHLGGSPDRRITSREMVSALRATLHDVTEWWTGDRDAQPLVLNLCVTDGRTMVASRVARGDDPPTLHTCHEPGFTLIASEELGDGREWAEVAPDTMVVVEENGAVVRIPA